MLHEAGHAMHSAATKDISIAPYTDTPSEVAELASMTMELLTMDYWDEYYSNPEDLKKAKHYLEFLIEREERDDKTS